jgi:hypothetical protein
MSFARFEVFAPERALRSNAYQIIRDALRHVVGLDSHHAVSLVVESFTDSTPARVLGGDDARYISGLVGENRAALELLDRGIAAGSFVCPRIPSPDHVGPETRPATHPLFEMYSLERLCYLQARLIISRREWDGALAAIERIFRFGALLLDSWGDSLAGVWGARIVDDAYRAVIELAIQPDVDPAALQLAARRVQETSTSGEAFLDVYLRPFWSQALTFLSGVSERCDVNDLIRSLLADYATRETLTQRRFLPSGPESLGAVRVWYPMVASDDEGVFARGAISSVSQWLADRCEIPFDKRATLEILERSLASLLTQRANEASGVNSYLRSFRSIEYPSYQLLSVLRAARTLSVSHVKDVLGGLLDEGGDVVSEDLPLNLIGKSLAADVVSACRSDLTTGLLFWHGTLLRRAICQTMLAISRYARAIGAFPEHLSLLVNRGYLDALPHDPYLDEPIGFDADERRLFVSPAVSEMAFCEDNERSWYVKIPGTGRNKGVRTNRC